MLQFLKDFKLVNYDLTINIIAKHTFKFTNIHVAFFTFYDNISFEILYWNSTFRKGLWATVTRRIRTRFTFFKTRFTFKLCHANFPH